MRELIKIQQAVLPPTAASPKQPSPVTEWRLFGSQKDFGTLVSTSFRGLYENLLLVNSKSFPVTSAHKCLRDSNCRHVLNVAEC